MKKIIVLCLIMICLMAFGGCGRTNTETDISQNNENAQLGDSEGATDSESEQDDNTMSEVASDSSQDIAEETTEITETAGSSTDTLVVYFSRTGEQYGVGVIEKGNTAIVAEMIAEQTGADTFEILPKEDYYPYTYDELTDVAKQEQNDNARPAYAGEAPDLSQYNTIFIGAPVWWGDWPMICYTFFEENIDGLAGKTLIPFSTHAGSGLSGFDTKLSAACPDSTVGTGLAISGADAQNNQDSVRQNVKDWISGLGY